MKVAMAAVAALLWQTVGGVSPTSQHLRWQRGIEVPAASGPVCAVLDAAVLAHAASASGNDLRVFREMAGAETEVPFVLTESEAEPDDTVEATVRNVSVRGDVIDFDLEMPRRTYSSIELKIGAKDFVGRAVVTAKSGTVLGSFVIFDRSGEGLARSTMLALAETMLPELHVSLRLTGPHGRTLPVSAAMVQGAEVPASREAQTLYTPVVVTTVLQSAHDGTQQAVMEVPAHVPVERVSFVLDPAFRGEFSRTVSVSGGDAAKDEETVSGSIWRVKLPGSGGDAARLHIDAVMGLTLRHAAKVVAEVHDAIDRRALPPLPIREVRLEMRQRSVCFDADAGSTYVLRYGDAGLGAPVYKQMQMGSVQPVMVMLGPESLNAAFHPEPETMDLSQRRAGVVWIVGVGGLVLIWAGAGSLIRRRGRV